jgi:hypothetical protein
MNRNNIFVPFVLLLTACSQSGGSTFSSADLPALSDRPNLAILSSQLTLKTNFDESMDASQYEGDTHACYFYTDKNFACIADDYSYFGDYDYASSLFYLVNPNRMAGYLYFIPNTLDSYYNTAVKYREKDCQTVESIYSQICLVADWSSDQAKNQGYSSVSSYSKKYDSTTYFNVFTSQEADGKKRSIAYYFALKTIDVGTYFSSLIVRETIKNNTTKKTTYFDYEWSFNFDSEYSDLSFTPTNYDLSLPDTTTDNVNGGNVATPK